MSGDGIPMDNPALQRKTRILTAFVIVANVLGNSLLGHGMQQVGETVSFSPLAYLAAFRNPFVIGGVCLLATWIIAQLSLLSWADLSYVLPITAIGYVLTAMLGHFVLEEPISLTRWCGIALITSGAILVGRTAPRTSHIQPADGAE